MHRYLPLSGARLLGAAGLLIATSALAQSGAAPASGCASPAALAIVPAAELPALLGKPVQQISLLHYRNERLSPIITQIDQRDSDGRYLLEDASARSDEPALLGPDDEIVFRLSDSAARLPAGLERASLFEIAVGNLPDGQAGWVYATLASPPAEQLPAQRQARYKSETDSIETARYEIGFFRPAPVSGR